MPLEVATAATPVPTMISRQEFRHVSCCGARSRRTEGAGTWLTPFERRDTLLEDVSRGVHQARVDVAQLLQPEELGAVLGAVEGEGRALVQRHRPRVGVLICLLYTSPSPRDQRGSRMPSSA